MSRIPSLIVKVLAGIAILLLFGWLLWNVGLNTYNIYEPITASPDDCDLNSSSTTRFAVIGDFGDSGQPEADVGALVDNWKVDFIVTVGDNNYPDGEASTIDENIGQYYQAYIHPYQGTYGPGASENRFFPALGNHDWNPGHIQPYLDYFSLPGNERYYDLERGPVHLFILDSDPHEPDGRRRDSVQAAWLEQKLVPSEAPWQLVFLHHPPFASTLGRETDREMQWPYARWGADAVISGHDHLYERLHYNGIPYFVNGLGGRSSSINNTHRFGVPIPGSQTRYNRDYGAMLVTATQNCINFTFYNRGSELIDSHTLVKLTES
jgi:hypothetical protein